MFTYSAWWSINFINFKINQNKLAMNLLAKKMKKLLAGNLT
jgi:hypothetical protein